MPMSARKRGALVTAASCLLLAGAVLAIRAAYAPEGAGTPPPPAADGWYQRLAHGIAAAQSEGRPLVILWGGAAPDRYERRVRTAEGLGDLALVKVRVDVATETPAAERLGLRAFPAIVVLAPDGREITRLEGRREVDEVVRTLRRAAEVPTPYADLDARAAGEVEAARRLVEVHIESARPDSALKALESLQRLSADAADSLLAAKALVGAGRFGPGADLAAEAAARPALAAEARWVRLVALMNLGRDDDARRLAAEALAADTGSPYARRVLLAYGVEYLVRGRGRLKDGIAFLEDFARRNPASPYAADAQLAAANLHAITPAGEGRALALYEAALEAGGRVGEAAEENLVEWATAFRPGEAEAARRSRARRAAAILAPHLEGAGGEDRDRHLFHLAALEATAGETEGALARWAEVGRGSSEKADGALLAAALHRIDAEADIEAGRPLLEDLLARFPDRATATAAWFHLGRVHLFAGRFDEAGEAFGHLANRADAFGEEARRYLDLLGEARQDAETARPFVAALVRRARGQGHEALADLRALFERAPTSPLADDVLLEIAKTEAGLQNRPAAERALRKILAEYRTSNQYPAARELLARLTGRREG